MVIAVSGKGGTGKTTLSALVVRYWIKRFHKPVLAVDADPNSNLGSKLGLECDCTIGGLREDALKHKHDESGTPKQRNIEYEVQQAIAEGRGFDLLSMGRGEGPGCYCSVNNMLRTFLHDVASGYECIVIDNEAGMEHLSRRTDDKVDLMLIVCDQTPTGMKSARRIAELATELEVVKGRTGLVVNRVSDAASVEHEASAATGLEVLGCVPDDPVIRDFELRSEPLLNLPDDSGAVAALNGILESANL